MPLILPGLTRDCYDKIEGAEEYIFIGKTITYNFIFSVNKEDHFKADFSWPMQEDDFSVYIMAEIFRMENL